MLLFWGPFLEGPEQFSHWESHSQISNLMSTEQPASRLTFECGRRIEEQSDPAGSGGERSGEEAPTKYQFLVSRLRRSITRSLVLQREPSRRLSTELFYSRILNMNRGSLQTRSFRRIHFSVFRKWLHGQERFPGLSGSGLLERLLTIPKMS